MKPKDFNYLRESVEQAIEMHLDIKPEYTDVDVVRIVHEKEILNLEEELAYSSNDIYDLESECANLEIELGTSKVSKEDLKCCGNCSMQYLKDACKFWMDKEPQCVCKDWKFDSRFKEDRVIK